MHILFLTDNFPPESNAPANRTFEHAVRWVQAGHTVTVITCFPNFPAGKIHEGFKNRWYSKEEMAGINVVRVKTYMTANERFVKRTLDYLSFMVTGFIASLFIKKPDIIVATSPQFFCAIAGLAASKVRRKPFVLEIRDLWPASIVALGVMKESLIIKILERLEKMLYRQADSIVVVTNVFKDEIGQSINNLEKISVVLNGVDPDIFKPIEKPAQLIQKYQIQNKFVVGYIGTHGLAHDLENVIRAAEHFKDREDIVLIFMGAGAERSKIENLVVEKNLKQVKMIPQQPREHVPEFLAMCDLSLIPLRNEPLFSTVIPSKLFECMGMGIPVLMALPRGEATKIVEKTQCGELVEPGDPEAMSEVIRSLADNSGRVGTLGQNAFDASKDYSRDTAAAKMLTVLEKTLEEFH